MATVLVTVALPTTRKDGTPASAADSALVRVYRDAAKVGEIAPAGITPVQLTDSNVGGGHYNYTATVVDANGVESDHSAPQVAVIPFAPLSAPVIVSISIP